MSEINENVAQGQIIKKNAALEFLKNTLRYVLSIPIALIASQIFYIIFAFVWKIWDLLAVPFGFLFNFEIFQTISSFINWFLFSSINYSFAVFIFLLCFYYVIPNNKFRNTITWLVCILYIAILALGFFTIENIDGFAIYESLVMIITTLFVTLSLTSEEGIFS